MIIIILLAAVLMGKALKASNEKHKRRMAALEREQARQAREQERIRKEQQRQAEQLRKHSEQIAKLEYRMSEAEAIIEAERDRIGKLYALLDIAEVAQNSAVPGSAADERAQRKILSLESQIERAEARLRKAQYTRKEAQSKLSA